ncbi:hypothetical protein RF55_15454 [Lasius niger]|uniref:Uncharacterized protein n=1 Tax=Lasius niger TaxID=67767 RepID=A0A0J7K6B3_LASNI|nr:hypothetical protein RF55_15454 [Lasius niger]
MREKIEMQKAAMHSIERALANFRKTPKAKMNRTAIQQRMNLLKTNFAQCERTHAELVINSTAEFRQEEKYFTDHLFINCEDQFYEALDYMAEKYQQLTPPTHDDTQESGGNNSSISAAKATPHLPRISLPKFTGNFIEWETFPKSEVVPSTTPDTKLGESSTVTSHLLSNPIEKPAGTLLATAWIRVSAADGRFSVFRALLDQGSAITLVTERLAQRLRLNRQRIDVTISGISGASVSAKHSVHIKVTARHGKGPSYSTSALILKSLTTYVPPRSINLSSLSHISGLKLADHDPTSHEGIDILIGADLYGCILLDGLRRDGQNQPVAQNTIFGWILSGVTSDISSSSVPSLTAHHCCPTSELTNQIRRFWEVEELPPQIHLTEEEQRCEEHFRTTHTRDEAGRYVLRLPFKQGPPIEIGESRYSALRSLQHLETRFNSNSTLADEYAAFLNEYEHLGHMKSVASPDSSTSQIVYIPHHAVIKESSSTTRVRVVFNASHKTSNGLSLNDHLMIGQKLQPDISAVLLRWRQFRYAYATDITKMYRQIRIDPRDINYQRILWKAPHESAVKEFQLLTVTYGTASAPYMALRVLQQLAQDEGANFPLAKSILQSHIYVDDCLFGADDKPLALQTRNQLIQLLGTAIRIITFDQAQYPFHNRQNVRSISGIPIMPPFLKSEKYPFLGGSETATIYLVMKSMDSLMPRRQRTGPVSIYDFRP